MANKRIEAFDLIRGFSLVLMVLIHIIDEFGSDLLQESSAALCCYAVASPLGAPIFVFIMGVFYQLSDNSSLKTSFKRGLLLILGGYLLNLVKGTIPIYLGLKFGVVTLEEILPYSPIYLLKTLDIFQFAGLALILMALVKHYLKKPLLYLLLAISLAFVSPLLWDRMTSSGVINFALEMLWGKDLNFNFPLFPWLAYPLIGMAYASYFKRFLDKSKFMLYAFILGMMMTLISLPFIIFDESFIFTDVHLHSMGTVKPNVLFAIVGILLSTISIAQFTIKRLPQNRLIKSVLNRLYFYSRNVTSFYVFQWLIIGWLNIEIAEISLFGAIPLIIVILLGTDRLLILRSKSE